VCVVYVSVGGVRVGISFKNKNRVYTFIVVVRGWCVLGFHSYVYEYEYIHILDVWDIMLCV